jgi:hypothetical protein
VARDRSNKLTLAMPAKYEPDFERRIDKRTAVGTALLQRLAAIQSDLGGVEGLSYAKQSLAKRAVWVEATVEAFEQSLANAQPIDLGAYTQAINSLLGLWRVLGVERRTRSVRSLRDVMSAS